MMQRTDAQGHVAGRDFSCNTVWGSRQMHGSSGGPEVVNLGVRGQTETPLGAASVENVVIGTTSWLFPGDVLKLGASPFLSTNILPLITAACSSQNPACR
jgi:hypothetical protein